MTKAPTTGKSQGGSGSSGGKADWPEHLADRLAKLRARLAEASSPAMLVTHTPDVRYLTDLDVDDTWLVVTERAVIVLTDSRFQQQVERSCPQAKLVVRDGPMGDALASACRDAKVEALSFQADHLTVAQHESLSGKLEKVALSPTRRWLLELRAVKDARELRMIRRALALQEQAFHQLLDQIRPGMTEAEVATLLEYNMRWIGADGVSFPTIVAIGANGSLPHHRPGKTRVKANTPILIDCGARAGGYCSDLTRVVAINGFSQKLTEVYNVVLEAQRAGIAAIRPGVALKDVDAAARRVIDDAGYGEHFGHGLGHGIGLEIHEEPTLSRRSEGELGEGHVVTVEPGVYLPGVGGVRIEDDVLVTAKGHRKLSTLPTDLESAII
jgi:Xaa-Pro aminopeptidase